MSEKKTLVESLQKFSQKFSKLTSDEQENAELPQSESKILQEEINRAEKTRIETLQKTFNEFVNPVTQDEYSRIKDNPFRGPTKYKVLRLDSGESIVELISKYNIGEYFIKYLATPEPIILEDLPSNLSIEGVSEKTECKLNPMLHRLIIELAVQKAIQAKGLRNQNMSN